jgi:hypothetical protein
MMRNRSTNYSSGGGYASCSSSIDDDEEEGAAPPSETTDNDGGRSSCRASSDDDDDDGRDDGRPPLAPSADRRTRAAARRRRRQQLQRRRFRRKTSSLGKDFQGTSGYLWGFLLLGLLFCVLDVAYIMKYVMARDEDLHPTSSSSSTSTGTTAASDNHGGAGETTLSQRHDEFVIDDYPGFSLDAGKEPILQLLREATGTTDLDPETVERLPTAGQVAALYGSRPVLTGLDTCRTFREAGDPSEHLVATAGTFNTGTNLLAELLIANCHLPARQERYGRKNAGVRWQVLWGKHTPVLDEAYRTQHRTYNDSSLSAGSMFPAVAVRDPFKWMQSMCRHEYGAQWKHSPEHCPNLVPLTESDGTATSKTGGVPVHVQYKEFSQDHDSLVEFWNEWYAAYVKAPFPRMIVRFEDLVFHPKYVITTVCECAGGELQKKPFTYIVDSAKKGDGAHGAKSERTSYIDALVKYGTEAGRYKGFARADLDYARQHLDPTLMRSFGYKYPPENAVTAS